jgi:hypothetical protein
VRTTTTSSFSSVVCVHDGMVTLNFQPDAIKPSLTLAACYHSSSQTVHLCLAEIVLHMRSTALSQQLVRAK